MPWLFSNRITLQGEIMKHHKQLLRVPEEISRTILAVSFLLLSTTIASAAPAAFHCVAPDSVWVKAHVPVYNWETSSGATQYEVVVDGASIATGVSQTHVSSPQPLADGRHTWFVRATGGGVTLASIDTGVFIIGTPPAHLWDYTDGFERGDLNDYISDGIAITTTALDGTRSASYKTASATIMHYAYNPAFTNTQEAEASVLFSLDDANADVGVGFANDSGVWCYAMIDRVNKSINVERRASYPIVPHTESGFARTNWTERQENGFYIWCSDTQPLPTLTQGTTYRLRFQMSNRLPSLGKAAQAIVENANGTVVCSVRSFLDDVYAPHPMFIIKLGNARVDDFRYQLLDRWSYNWKAHIGPLNPTWSGFNPAVWRDANNKWWMTSRTDNKIRWSTDGTNWSTQTANAPPVSIMDPAIIGMHGNPWNDGRTYLASCDGCCTAPVQIFYSTDPGSGNWTKWGEHPGLPDCGREHVFLDTKDWPTLDSIHYNGAAYRFLSVLEGDVGHGGSTMIKLTNDQVNYVKIECTDLYGNATNSALEQKNLWMMECLNSASSSAMALDSNIRVMGFKDGMRYEKAIPQEIILDGKSPWIVKAIQTIPGFPYYWGDWHTVRDKAGASWYGGKYEWPACFVWVPEEKRVYSYWGEENTINLSTALVIPEFCCASLLTDTSTVDPGNQVRVTANIWNFGDADGIDTVNILSDGTQLDSRVLRMAANTDSSIVFTLSALAAGAHVLSIDNCKTAVFVTGSSAVVNPGTVVTAAFRADKQYTIRIFDMLGRNVRTVQSDDDVLNPAILLQNHARGLYVANVYKDAKLIKNKVVLR
jgi:hypothetical protein